MGSERKSKEEKKKRRRSPSYDSDAEGKGKRVRTVEDRKSKSSKGVEKDKSLHKKKSKSHKSSKHRSDKEKKLEEKRRKDKGHKHDRHSKLKIQEISNDDYFSKNNEFATWLKEEREIFFSDLSSNSARDLFSQFIKDWNNQKLESRYYEGIVTGPRTAHNWKIK